MNFQRNVSTTAMRLLGVGMVGLSAALLVGLPSSAQGKGGSSDSSPGIYGGSSQSPSDRVAPQTPSDTTNRPTTDPSYGNPSGSMGNSGPTMRGGSGTMPSTTMPQTPGSTVDPAAGGVISPNPNMPAPGSMGRPSTETGRSGEVKKGPSAVGEGFPGPSESPSGSPSVPGTSTVDNPARSN